MPLNYSVLAFSLVKLVYISDYFSDHAYMYIKGTCDDLPDINNGHEVSYTPPHSVFPSLPDGERYTGTIATYNCSSGSSLRACGADGEWNGTATMSCFKGKF